MIEVLFGESEYASMKLAKSKALIGEGQGSNFLERGEKNDKKGICGSLLGALEEVICLNFFLDIGDIREKTDSPYRKELIYNLCMQERRGEERQAYEKAWDLALRERRRLKEYLQQGEMIRIWYSDAPYSICGFYHLCSMLSGYKNGIRAVKLPAHMVDKKQLILYQGWGEVAPEKLVDFLLYEREVSTEEIRIYCGLWEQLKKENTPLRALVNGRLIGVGEDFYDFLIWKELSDKPIRIGKLIGNILGKYPLSVREQWYIKRIRSFIEQGKIKVTGEAEIFYGCCICRGMQ